MAETFLEALVWFLVNNNKTSVGEGETATTGHEDQADENKVISLVKPSGKNTTKFGRRKNCECPRSIISFYMGHTVRYGDSIYTSALVRVAWKLIPMI